jgi:hypothetical protein
VYPSHPIRFVAAVPARAEIESTFFPALLTEFLASVAATHANFGHTSDERFELQCFCRMLVLVVDLLAQLPTRRFFRVLLEDMHFFTKCQLSPLARAAADAMAASSSSETEAAAASVESASSSSASPASQIKLFAQLLDMLQFYLRFEIDEHSGAALRCVRYVDHDTCVITYGHKTTFRSSISTHASYCKNTVENSLLTRP